MPNDMSPMRREAPFDLARFLEGETRAWGIFEDRFGRLRRKFHVTIWGEWLEGRLVLTERFVYDDGQREERIWQIAKGPAGRFTAASSDCLGIAEGEMRGDTARMRYAFRLKLKSRALDVSFDDAFYRMDQSHMMNRATVRKWGVTLGAATIFFQKMDRRMAA